MTVRKDLKSALDRTGQASEVKMSFMPLIVKVSPSRHYSRVSATLLWVYRGNQFAAVLL